MARSIHGTIGAALLCCVALITQQCSDLEEDQAKNQTQVAHSEQQAEFNEALGTCLQGHRCITR